MNISIHNFMKSFRHREVKGYMFSNRQMVFAHAANMVLGITSTRETYKLSMDSSGCFRKKKRRRYRDENR